MRRMAATVMSSDPTPVLGICGVEGATDGAVGVAPVGGIGGSISRTTVVGGVTATGGSNEPPVVVEGDNDNVVEVAGIVVAGFVEVDTTFDVGGAVLVEGVSDGEVVVVVVGSVVVVGHCSSSSVVVVWQWCG